MHRDADPVFCRWPVLFAAVTIAELGALLPLLDPLRPWNFSTFGLASLFAVWLALITLAVLCFLARRLERLGSRGWAAAWFLLIAVAWVMAYAVVEFDRTLQWGLTGSAPAGRLILRIVVIAALLGGALLRYLVLDERWRRGRLATEQSRFNALQARIRPHFLFNVLNTVAALVPDRPKEAIIALEKLATLLRNALSDPEKMVPLDKELQLCRDYLALQQLRFGSRLAVRWELPELPAEMLVLPLSLQPLVENAVVHGIAPQPEGGVITIRARLGTEALEFEIDNPNPSPAVKSNGLALANLDARLKLHYGSAATLTVWPTAARFVVRLKLPLAASQSPPSDATPAKELPA